MLIGELSRQTGLSRDTIRYYEKLGLFGKRKKKRRHNTFQEYDADDLKKLFFVMLCKDYGFTLQEIKDLIGQHEADVDIFKTLPDRVRAKMNDVDEKLSALLTIKLRLHTLLQSL